jgi:hypothetical protein
LDESGEGDDETEEEESEEEIEDEEKEEEQEVDTSTSGSEAMHDTRLAFAINPASGSSSCLPSGRVIPYYWAPYVHFAV